MVRGGRRSQGDGGAGGGGGGVLDLAHEGVGPAHEFAGLVGLEGACDCLPRFQNAGEFGREGVDFCDVLGLDCRDVVVGGLREVFHKVIGGGRRERRGFTCGGKPGGRLRFRPAATRKGKQRDGYDGSVEIFHNDGIALMIRLDCMGCLIQVFGSLVCYTASGLWFALRRQFGKFYDEKKVRNSSAEKINKHHPDSFRLPDTFRLPLSPFCRIQFSIVSICLSSHFNTLQQSSSFFTAMVRSLLYFLECGRVI